MSVVQQRQAWRTYQTEQGVVSVHRMTGSPGIHQLIRIGRDRGYGPCSEAVIAKLLTDRSNTGGFLLALKPSGALEVLMVWTGGTITVSELSLEGVVRSGAPCSLLMTSVKP